MDDPDIVLCVYGDTNGHADDPMVRQWLGPHRLDFEHRHLHRGGLHGRPLFKRPRSKTKRGDERDKSHTDPEITLHNDILPDALRSGLLKRTTASMATASFELQSR